MALVKKPPQTVERCFQLEELISSLLDDYCKFVECSPDYVTNFALKKMLAGDPEYKKWKASQPEAPALKQTALSSHHTRTA